MTSFDKPLIKKMARLARIRFNDQELENFSSELSEILDVIVDLQRVDTSNVVPVHNVNSEMMVWRKDEVSDGNCPEKILANSKYQNFNCFTVPKVIE